MPKRKKRRLYAAPQNQVPGPKKKQLKRPNRKKTAGPVTSPMLPPSKPQEIPEWDYD